MKRNRLGSKKAENLLILFVMALFKIRYYLLAILIVIVLLKFRYYLLATMFVMALLKVGYYLLAQIMPLIKVLLLSLTTVPHYHHSQLQIMNLNQIIQKIQQKQKLLFSPGATAMACGVPMAFPGFMAPLLPFPFPLWHGFRPTELPPNSNVFKPRAEIPKSPVNIIDEIGISKLSIGDPLGSIEPSGLSLKLLNKPSRQSAFHTNPALNDNGFSSNSNAIHVA